MALKALLIFLVAPVVICESCDKIFTTESGEIRSPGSSSYPNNAYCSYIIKGSPRIRTVQFTFESFRTESGCDYLYFGDDKYAGSQPKGKQLNYTFSNSFKLRFTTDGSVTFSGFIIKYKLVPEPCREGRYGANCTEECSEGCKTDTCEWKDGSCDCKPGWTGNRCSQECRAGFYGQNCSSECSSGCSDVCTRDTGRCTCKPGKTGAKCDATCPSGTYDSYCTKSCSPGCLDGSCSKEDGSCSCKSGYRGSRCDDKCYTHSYGPGCNKLCSQGCVYFSCDGITGSCECKPGWTGEQCNQECAPGLYGLNCSEQCSSGCSDTCKRQDGKCTCRAGWEGEKCDAECPADKHGVACESSCSPGCVEGACHPESGLCACLPGWMGDRCLQGCENGTYGDYCQYTCSGGCVNDTCSIINGTCTCVPGYLGDRCSFNLILIYSVASGVLVAILVSVAVFCLIVRRKKNKQASILKTTQTINDALSMKYMPRASPEGNDYVEYAEDHDLYQEAFDDGETDYENVTFNYEQQPVFKTGKATEHAREDNVYGNVHFSSNRENEEDDVEEDYQNVAALRGRGRQTK